MTVRSAPRRLGLQHLVLILFALGCPGTSPQSSDAGPEADAGPQATSDGGSTTQSDGGADAGSDDPNEPAYDATKHALILEDDFDGYADMNAARAAYPVGRDTHFAELVAGRGGAGNAVRLNYGAPDWAEDILFGPETRLDSVGGWNGTLPEVAGPYTHFFFSTWFRVSPGADPVENDDTGSGVKGFMFWHAGGGRYQNPVNRLLHPDGETRGPKGANLDNAASGLSLYKTPDGRAPAWAASADGQWHRFTVELYAGNDPSGHFGQRYWLDGQPIYSDVDLDVSGAPVNHYDYAQAITHWMVFGNFVSTAARSSHFTIDFDDWIAWTD